MPSTSDCSRGARKPSSTNARACLKEPAERHNHTTAPKLAARPGRPCLRQTERTGDVQLLVSIDHEARRRTRDPIVEIVRRVLLDATPSSIDDGDPKPNIRVEEVRGDHLNDTTDALIKAERFISGFEDDETQEGIADILAGLRGAIHRERLRPVLLDALMRLRAAAMGFRLGAYRSERGLQVGDEAVNMLSAALLDADRIIAQSEDQSHG